MSLQVKGLKEAREQIAFLIKSYVPGLKVWVMPVQFHDGYKECKVYVELPHEHEELDDYEYNANYGYWGSHVGRVNRHGRICALYLFKWK
jgi:hypothetical protein